jgi:hypothetical protein
MLTREFIVSLYNTHTKSLKTIRGLMKNRIKYTHDGPPWCPQYDDTEAEITALLMIHFKPNVVVEFSPCNGWSSSIILDTLSINNNNALLKSYDIHDNSTKNVIVPNNCKWDFELGDVSKKYKSWDLGIIDYLFIDSDHSRDFAKIFVKELLEPLLENCKKNNRKVPVSVHDVFHKNIPSEEGEEVIHNFLDKHNISYFTPSKMGTHYVELLKTKKSLGLDEGIHTWNGRRTLEQQTNPSIFFILE